MKGVLGDASCYADPQNVMYCLLYSACSASLLLINRLIMHQMPMASFVSSLQFAASMVTALLVMVQGGAAVDAFEWRKVKPYLLYVSMFVTTIYCNFRALEVSNVETLIVARSCVPFNVAILEFLCMGRAFPNLRSWFAMGLMVLGAAGYVASDKQFELDGWAAYTWVTAYFVVISFEMTVGKYIVGPHLGFASMWGPTLYTNTISIPPMITIGLLTDEQSKLCAVEWTAGLGLLLFSSCVVGVSISYLGFKARSLVSATCFTVLGVANKMATVTANVLIWDQHASAFGIASLVVCLIGAAIYEQSPMRAEKVAESKPDKVEPEVSAPASARGGWLWGPGSTSSTSAPPSPPPPLTAAEIAYREEQNREAMIEALGAACRRGL